MSKYETDFFSKIGNFLCISISKKAKMQFFHKKCVENLVNSKKSSTFALAFEKDTFFDKANSRQLVAYMVAVAQLVRASDCGSEGCGIVPHLPPR